MIKKNETSYEIIWATLRIAPKWAYLEFDAHPIINKIYTLILEIIKNRRILCLLSNGEKAV